MTTPMRAMAGFSMLLCLALAAGACYPDESGPRNHELSGLRLPLGDWGIELQAGALDRWIDWLDTNDGFGGTTFDLTQDGNNFAMGLHLRSLHSDEPIGFVGHTITLDRTSGEDVLWVDMSISDCTDCWFEVVIFWRDPADPDLVQTFVGDNAATMFDVVAGSPDNPQTIVVDAQEQAVGEISCVPGSQAVPASARISVRDVMENVRLYAQPADVGGSVVAHFSNLPIDRELMVELDGLGDGRYFSDVESVILVSEGQEGTVELP